MHRYPSSQGLLVVALVVPFLSVSALAGAQPSGIVRGAATATQDPDALPLTQQLHTPSYSHWPLTTLPQGTGGRLLLGGDGMFSILDAPSGAEVELRRSWVGQGVDDCTTYSGTCLAITQSEVYATGTTDEDGNLQFFLDGSEYTTTGTLGWQAVVRDPATGRWGTTDGVIRHIAVAQADSDIQLTNVNQAAGLTDVFTTGNSHTGGMAWVDVNNDYWPDLFVVSAANTPNYLFLNRGDGTFSDVSRKVHKPDLGMECAGARYADIDNDGDYDLMVPVDYAAPMVSSAPQVYDGGPNYLFRNDGDLEFVDVAAEAGVLDPLDRRNSDASFADFNRDGCIDLYLVNWAMAALPAGDNYDRILEGDCQGHFDDVTADLGVDGHGRDGLVAFWFDADRDLWPDLYIGNNADLDDPPDYDPDDIFYRNDGGVFTDVTSHHAAGTHTRATMGMDMGDIDHDGDWDLYLTDVWYLGPRPKGNALYLGAPDGSLSDNVCQERGVCFGYNSWPTNFADFDLDGHVDFWVGSSRTQDYDYIYINDGTGHFEAHAQNVFQNNLVRAGSIADYDGDGDMDIFMWRHSNQSLLFRNDLRNDHHYAAIKLFGSVSTADAIGATAIVTLDGVTDMRRVSGGDSAHSQSDSILHFGTGQHENIDQLEIQWPSGIVQIFTDLPVDELYFIHEEIGLLEENVRTASASWSESAQTLTVQMTTNFGGRSRLSLADTGQAIAWNVDHDHYELTVPAPDAVDEVAVLSERGGRWTLPVATEP